MTGPLPGGTVTPGPLVVFAAVLDGAPLRAAVAAGGITAWVAEGEPESLGVVTADGVSAVAADASEDALETGPSAGWLLNRPATEEDDDPQPASNDTHSPAATSKRARRSEPRAARSGMGLLPAEMFAWSP